MSSLGVGNEQKPKARVALKKPFGALNNGYYGPRPITIFPKESPKVRGSEKDAQDHVKTILRTCEPIGDLWVGFGEWSGGRHFNWPRSVATILAESLP